MTRHAAVIGAIASLSCACAFPVRAQSADEFYQKNGLVIVVASGAGGGYDIYSRVLARYYTNHLPGKPNIIVQNMPGAAGLTATNWAYNSAPRDGSRLVATYSALFDANLVGNKNAQFDIRKLNWIGSIASSPLICVTWHTSPYKDIRQMIGKELTAAASGQASNMAIMPLLLNETLETRFKIVSGYSTSETTLALERGEADVICGSGLSTLRASNPDWFTDNKINIAAQTGLREPEEALKDVPNVLNLLTGKNREIFEYRSILEAMGRPYLAPPDIPADRLGALRKGFDETMRDPGFLSDMAKLKLEVSPMTAQEMDGWLDKLYKSSPETIKRMKALYGAK